MYIYYHMYANTHVRVCYDNSNACSPSVDMYHGNVSRLQQTHTVSTGSMKADQLVICAGVSACPACMYAHIITVYTQCVGSSGLMLAGTDRAKDLNASIQLEGNSDSSCRYTQASSHNKLYEQSIT